jgi:ubiquinone/menaquinone biosynthesis C-methylase UbiE
MISRKSHAVLDIESRKRKAAAIISLLGQYASLKNARVLDIGTGAGVIASEIAKVVKKVNAADVCDERLVKKGYSFTLIKSEKVPFMDNSFDVVISNHVMAHTNNGDAHLKEVARVLKKGGVAYISMLNRFCIVEPNFNLPFLSWLPQRLADSYVHLTGKGKAYDVHPLTYWEFMRKLRNHFDVADVTSKVAEKTYHVPAALYNMGKAICPIWVTINRKR